MYDTALIFSPIKVSMNNRSITKSTEENIFFLSMRASSYRVIGCLSVRIQAIETVDSKHINPAASVCQHILLLSKTHNNYITIINLIIIISQVLSAIISLSVIILVTQSQIN